MKKGNFWQTVFMIGIGSIFLLPASGLGAVPKGLLRVAITGVPGQFGKQPLMFAIERLKEQGYQVDYKIVGASELPIQAAMRGEADISTTSMAPYLAAVEAGADLKLLAESRKSEYVMLTKKEIKSAKDLQDKLLAIHSRVSATALLANAYLKNYPDIKPRMLIMRGSPIRGQALLAGQIDATVADFGDALRLQSKKPGAFNVLMIFAKEMPLLIDAIYSARPGFIEKNQGMVLDFVRAMIWAHRKVTDDAGFLIKKTPQYSPDMEPQLIPQYADVYLKNGVWDVNGGLETEAVKFTIDAHKEAGMISPKFNASPESLVDRRFLNQTLKETGKR